MMDRNELLKVMKEHTQSFGFEKYEEDLKSIESGSDDIKFVIDIGLELIQDEDWDVFEKELEDILKSLHINATMDRGDEGYGACDEIKGTLESFKDFRILVYTIDYFMKNHSHENSHLGYDWMYMDSAFGVESDGTLRISYFENWSD